MNHRIDIEDDLAKGFEQLTKIEPRFADISTLVCPLPMRRKPEGFATLLDAINGQQISTAAAAAIWERIKAAGYTVEKNVCNASEDDLRACGLSQPKAKYAKAIASAGVDWVALGNLDNEAAIRTLVSLPGIGRWSAEIYVLSAMGRADIMPAGDLALQEAARQLFDLNERPSEKVFREMSSPWAPWRAVAARALWSYYRAIKQREGIR